MIYSSNSLVKKPVISICVTTYNQEKYLKDTLDSILSQKIDVLYEIIISDDCSLDNTKNVCLDYQKKYPDKILFNSNEKNVGLIKNLFNILLSISRGEYIALCAGDDIWIDENKLKKQLEILKNNSAISIVHTGYNKYYELNNRIVPISHWNSPLLTVCGERAISHVVLEHFSSFPCASSIMFRKSTIINNTNKYPVLIDEKNAAGEGMILFTFAALEGVFAFIPDIMVNYRVREQSLCHYKDKNLELIFNFKYRIIQKTIVVKTILNDINLVKKVNKKLLVIFYESIITKCVSTFMILFKNYEKENIYNIPSYIRLSIYLFHKNKFTQKIFIFIFNTLSKIKKLLYT